MDDRPASDTPPPWSHGMALDFDVILVSPVCPIPGCLAPGQVHNPDMTFPLCREHDREQRAQLLGWES